MAIYEDKSPKEYMEEQKKLQADYAANNIPTGTEAGSILARRMQEVEDEITRRFGARVEYDEFRIGKKTFIVRSTGIDFLSNIFGILASFGLAAVIMIFSIIPFFKRGKIITAIVLFLVVLLLVGVGIICVICLYKEIRKRNYEHKLIKAGLMDKEPFDLARCITFLVTLFVISGLIFMCVGAFLNFAYGINVFEKFS